MSTRIQEKGAVTLQETESDLPVSVQESPVGVGLQWPAEGLGHCLQQSWEPQHADICPFEGGHHYQITPTIVWPQTKVQGGNTASPISRNSD